MSGARWRVWLPVILLAVVAATQIVLTKTADLSPWKGGGFGMFATLDGSAARRVRIVVEAEGFSEDVEIAGSQEILAARASLFPSNSKMQALAEAVATREKRYGRAVDSITIEILRSEFNDLVEATERPLQIFTLNVDRSN